jgi:hypothetical protein
MTTATATINTMISIPIEKAVQPNIFPIFISILCPTKRVFPNVASLGSNQMFIEINHFTPFRSTFMLNGNESPTAADGDGIIASYYSIYYHRPTIQVKFGQDYLDP